MTNDDMELVSVKRDPKATEKFSTMKGGMKVRSSFVSMDSAMMLCLARCLLRLHFPPPQANQAAVDAP